MDKLICGAATQRGFTLLETLLALSVLLTALLAFYVTSSRALILSETNKQIKMALLHAESIVEELQGCPFDSIMDPDYPSYDYPNPRYRHLQNVDHVKLWGKDPATGQAFPPPLDYEEIRVWYGSRLDVNDKNGNLDYTDAEPLDYNTTYDNNDNTAVPRERYRPLNNSPLGDEFITPEPLYITVEVSWLGPTNRVPDGKGGFERNMFQRITFVRSR
ncbi:MAG TPA: prepilin-type N-terminal cleavage/methylation domain-containing protein [Planctomycetota bacterium]|jgi:prepilin-type N-terminal cleavage/methylation domain-containing protein